MALRYLAGKLRVPAGAALRRAEGSRGIASGNGSHQVGSRKEFTSELWTEEELQRIAHDREAMIRHINEENLSRQRYENFEALCVSGGALLGFFSGVLLVRYDNRNGGKIGKMLFGVRSE